MATLAIEVGSRRVKLPKRRGKVRMVVVHGGRELPTEQGNALLVDLSLRIGAKRLQSRLGMIERRHGHVPERLSVEKAMLAVEEHLVKAFWTIARQPGNGGSTSRCGVSYVHDPEDVDARYADAAGGKWESIAPRPSLPSSRDIDAANVALDWLLLIDDERMRKLLVMGATSKRGDAGRRINWERLHPGLREHNGVTVRTLQRKYQEALRIIVSELTIARMSSVSHKGA